MSNTARRWIRRQYLTRHQAQRRALLKAEGGRRVEVTLRGASLDHYAILHRCLRKGDQAVIVKALDIAANCVASRK